MARGAGCLNWARPDLWGAEVGNCPGLPDFAFLYEFEQHGVEVWEAVGGKCLSDDDPASWVTSGFGAHASRDEQVKKASRGLGKKAILAREGRWTGGPVPYGFRVVCLATGDEGVERERWSVEIEAWDDRLQIHPDGREVRYRGKHNFPKDRGKADRLVLRPTLRHPDRLEAIRLAYRWITQESISRNLVARRLNDRGYRPTTSGAALWYSHIVYRMLRNPVYIGRPSYNKKSSARFAHIDGEGRVALDPPKPTRGQTKPHRVLPRSEWVGPDRAQFPPVVPIEQWVKPNKGT